MPWMAHIDVSGAKKIVVCLELLMSESLILEPGPISTALDLETDGEKAPFYGEAALD